MYAYTLTAAALRAVTALTIVLALGYTFEYGDSMTFAAMLNPLLGG